MAWIFLAESEDSPLPWSLGSSLSPIVKSTDIAELFFCHEPTSGLGYDCRWGVLSAFDVGAPHKRERWWLLAHRNGDRREEQSQRDREGPKGSGALGDDANRLRHNLSDPKRVKLRDEQRRRGGENGPDQAEPGDNGPPKSLANTEIGGRRQRNPEPGRRGERAPKTEEWGGSPFGGRWWESEPNVGRVVNGLPRRVDRIRSLGNAVVPAQAREAFRRLSGLK